MVASRFKSRLRATAIILRPGHRAVAKFSLSLIGVVELYAMTDGAGTIKLEELNRLTAPAP